MKRGDLPLNRTKTIRIIYLVSLLSSQWTLVTSWASLGSNRISRLGQLRIMQRRQLHLQSIVNENDDSLKDGKDALQKHSRLCLAPMMKYTNRHFRAMMRLLSSNMMTYTEMVAADELLADKRFHNVKELLGQSRIIPAGPSILQFGGNDASQLHDCAKIYHEFSQTVDNKSEYTALNLNCGCPSASVSRKKCFGAALMKDPAHVTKLVRAMHDGVDGKVAISVKCRIGVHENNEETPFTWSKYDQISEKKEYDKLRQLVETIADDGIVTDFHIHARIAVLGGGLSTDENRRIPPLKYEYVHKLADQYPELNFVLNGGIHSLAQAKKELDKSTIVGVMVGRALVADPWGFSMADDLIFKDSANDPLCTNRIELLEAYGKHADNEEEHNDPAMIRRSLVAPCAHLFAGEPNALQFRIELDKIAARPEQLQREAKSRVWSNVASIRETSTLASAFLGEISTGGWNDIQTSSNQAALGLGWDDMQAIDDRTKWDENESNLSELILDAAHRHFGHDVLNRSRKESCDKRIWEEEQTQLKIAKGDPVLFVTENSSNVQNSQVSGGVIDGWFKNGLN